MPPAAWPLGLKRPWRGSGVLAKQWSRGSQRQSRAVSDQARTQAIGRSGGSGSGTWRRGSGVVAFQASRCAVCAALKFQSRSGAIAASPSSASVAVRDGMASRQCAEMRSTASQSALARAWASSRPLPRQTPWKSSGAGRSARGTIRVVPA